jgi:hypothetical protein
MFGGTPVSNKQNGNASIATSTGWPHDVSKRDAVRKTLEHVKVENFNMKYVKQAMLDNFPEYAAGITDNQLSATLSKFAEIGKDLKLVKKKVGKSSAVYAKP